jgi:hypothetical protein
VRVADPRSIISALIGAFCAAFIFATVTTVRHISNRADPVIAQPGVLPTTVLKKPAKRNMIA